MSSVCKFEIAIMGYLRELENKYWFTVPNDVKIVILAYYPIKINYIGKFTKENVGRCIKIQSDQLSFHGYRSAKLNAPLPISLKDNITSMIYRWRAVNEDEKDPAHYAVIFGVVSNRCIDFHEYPYSNLVDAYGISMQAGLVFYGTDEYNQNDANEPDYKGFKGQELIGMEYEISNSSKCKLSFYNESKDNEFMFEIDLPNEVDDEKIEGWYPVFSKPNSSKNIRIIPY